MAKFVIQSGLLVLLSAELAFAIKFLDENGKELPKLDGTLDEPEGFDDPRIRDLLTANDQSPILPPAPPDCPWRCFLV